MKPGVANTRSSALASSGVALPGLPWLRAGRVRRPRRPLELPPLPDDRPHGLDIIEALAGPGNWGTETTGDGGRIAWAQLAW